MPAANGPLRFFVADATENLVFGPTNLSVSKVNQLNVINPVQSLSAASRREASERT